MGELSAKHLRGDSMADVIFNGSASRKPVGTASVELVFDNSDGKICGPYADYNEVSLKRLVSRDGTSDYFLNGARCRRKDITQLFLGTGLGSRSYAIIEQGMISRVIEAKADDMRAFVEEAAGISRYKERRKETEARIADTRENLERLQDVRDEVDKQIRHLQRQAGDRAPLPGAEGNRAPADGRGAGAAPARDRHGRRSPGQRDARVRAHDAAGAGRPARRGSGDRERSASTRPSSRSRERRAGRYYEVGAEIAAPNRTSTHTRELREQQRNELAQVRDTLAELDSHIQRDERQIERAARRDRRARSRSWRRPRRPKAALNEGTERRRGSASPAGSSAGKNSTASWAPRTRPRRWSARASSSWKTSCAGCPAQSDRLAVEREALMAQESSALLGAARGEGIAWRAAPPMSCRAR